MKEQTEGLGFASSGVLVGDILRNASTTLLSGSVSTPRKTDIVFLVRKYEEVARLRENSISGKLSESGRGCGRKAEKVVAEKRKML